MVFQSYPELRLGARNESVSSLQQLLKDRGFSVTVDGAFGAGTLAAVKAFQASKGLTSDGIVGPQTWGALGQVAETGGGSTGIPSSSGSPLLPLAVVGGALAAIYFGLMR